MDVCWGDKIMDVQDGYRLDTIAKIMKNAAPAKRVPAELLKSLKHKNNKLLMSNNAEMNMNHFSLELIILYL